MPRRACESCGKQYDAKRPSSKFCGDTCRKRAQRAPKTSPSPAPPSREPAPGILELPPDPFAGVVETTTRAELDAAGRTDSALGAAALAIARKVDAISHETGASAASVVKEHRAALAEALKGVATRANPLDELTVRRERRRVV